MQRRVFALLAVIVSFSQLTLATTSVYFCTSANEKILARLQIEGGREENQLSIEANEFSMASDDGTMTSIYQDETRLVVQGARTASKSAFAQLSIEKTQKEGSQPELTSTHPLHDAVLLAGSLTELSRYELTCIEFNAE